jgi:hypothetical protein
VTLHVEGASQKKFSGAGSWIRKTEMRWRVVANPIPEITNSAVKIYDSSIVGPISVGQVLPLAARYCRETVVAIVPDNPIP